MYLRVPLYRYKSAKSISISISSVTPTGNLNKYNFAISTSICPTGDLNKHKSAISTRLRISSLYEFMKILIFATIYLLMLNAYYKCVYA